MRERETVHYNQYRNKEVWIYTNIGIAVYRALRKHKIMSLFYIMSWKAIISYHPTSCVCYFGCFKTDSPSSTIFSLGVDIVIRHSECEL